LTKRLNDTETEISAETDTESFRSLVAKLASTAGNFLSGKTERRGEKERDRLGQVKGNFIYRKREGDRELG